MTTYPSGYGTAELSLDALFSRHFEGKMHPEYRRRLRAFLEAQGGRLGIGDGFRINQPNGSGFAPPGKSFHQAQRFASGQTVYSAVDLVCRVPGKGHSSGAIPTSWVPMQGSQWARDCGLHINVGTPGKPGFEVWHIQCIEVDGYDTWVATGRRDPRSGYPIVGVPVTPPEPLPDPQPKPPVSPGGPNSWEDEEMYWLLSQWHDGSWWWVSADLQHRRGTPADNRVVMSLMGAPGGYPTIKLGDAELAAIPE